MANRRSIDFEKDSSQNASRADTVSLSITQDISIELWVKFESTPTLSGAGNGMTFVAKYDGSSNKSYIFGLRNNSGTLQLFSDISQGSDQNIAAVDWTPSLATWYHVAWTRTRTSDVQKFYVNASQQGADQTAMNADIGNTTADFQVGANTQSFGGQFDGKMDELRVWNDVRTISEIADNRSKELVGTEANLVAYYKFSLNVQDETANANHLTANNNPTYSTDVPFDPIQGGGFLFHLM